jgi:O-antigen ligase
VINFRLFLIIFIGISASLPMAWISISKVLLILTSLIFLISNKADERSDSYFNDLKTPGAIVLILFLFTISLLWTDAQLNIAAKALAKHAKLLEVLLLISLIRTAKQASIGIIAFLTGQVFLLIISYLLAAGLVIPWANQSGGRNVVFSSYLDQSIMLATTSGLFWHLKNFLPVPKWITGLLAIASLANVFLFLDGRSGYAVGLVVLGLAAMWLMPKKIRLMALFGVPTIVLLLLFIGSNHLQERASKIFFEAQDYGANGKIESSSGWRLHAWRRSVEAIAEKPLTGHGVGSWTTTVKRIEGEKANIIFGEGLASNPHQEYLLWGVELGVFGSILLMFLIYCIIRDALNFEKSISRATISVALAMGVACSFNSALYDSMIGDFFCIALGLLMALGIRKNAAEKNNIVSG